MSRRPILLMVLLLSLAAIGWWFRDPGAPTPAAIAPIQASGVDTPAASAPAMTVNGPTELEPGAAPNSATAHWITDTQRRGWKSPPLPFPLDASLDRAAARALYRKAQEVSACYRARNAVDIRTWEQWTGTAWLEAPERERVLQARRAVIERQLGNCRRHGLSELNVDGASNEPIPLGFVPWARASAAASGDPGARANHYQRLNRRANVDTEIRPLLRQLLVEDPQDLPAMGPLHTRHGQELGAVLHMDPARAWRDGKALDPEALWLLVACDMGMDCGGTSNQADRLCLDHGLCGYPDVEAAVRDGLLGSSELELTMQARRQIVELLGRGDLAAIVDRPPPEPPKPTKPRPR